MTERPGTGNSQGEPAQVACQVCMAEIPHDEAKSMESQDYVIYFCGLECYDQWVQKDAEREDSPPE